MEPQTLPSTPASKLACPTNQETVSESIPHDNWDAPWTLARVSASEVEFEASQWHQEQSNGTVYIIGKYDDDDDAYEVIIDPPHLLGLRYRQLQFDLRYNPTKPGGRQKDVYGTPRATERVCALWLRHAAYKIRSEQHPEVRPAYCHFARLNDLYEALARAIRIHDISTSTPRIRRNLAQNLVISFLAQETDHDSFDTYHYLTSNEDDLLESLQLSLLLPVPPKRTRSDETQMTSLTRALLELSGGRVDLQQHGFAQEYTVCDNADLYALVLGITRKRTFGDIDPEEMCNALLESPVFSGVTISAQSLENRTMQMMDFLRIGFPKNYLNLPSRVLCGFSVAQLDLFNAYLAHTYHTFPSLPKPENNIPLLVTWSTMLSNSLMDFRRQLVVICEWANSEDGQNLYEQLARDVQGFQNVEQLALNMAALMNYRRLCPDLSDDTDQPITGSYLVDLDSLFHGHSLGNSGRVAEQMVFAFVRVLCRMDQHKELVVFLNTVLDREPPLLHFFDGLADQYLEWKIHGRTHETAFETVMEQVSRLKVSGLRRDDDSDRFHHNRSDWVLVQDALTRPGSDCTLPAAETRFPTEQAHGVIPIKINITQTTEVSTGTATAQEDMTPSHIVAVSSHRDERHLSSPPGLRADDYTLIRLSNRRLLETLDKIIGLIFEMPNIEKLNDGSWEICILKSYRLIAQSTLGKMFPDSDIDLHYNPLEPTAQDVKVWGYDKAKKACRQWLFERSIRVVSEGWSVAAAYYSSLLRVMFGLDEAAAGFAHPDSSNQQLIPTYQGCIRSKEDAVYLLEACLRGDLVHSCQGPRDGEAAISGNVFVWEANSTGIDRWRDGLEWNVREQDACEVGEASNCSGLMKKTFSIPACGSVHHVVSYYTARDIPTLHGPSRSMTVRPEVACALAATGPSRLSSSA